MILLLFTLLFFAALAFFCLRVRVHSPFHRALTRGVCALWALIFCSLIPGIGIGVNALNTVIVGALGLPGLGLLAVLAGMP